MKQTDRYKIYTHPIPSDDRPRREREAEAKSALLLEAFGDGITLSHDKHGTPFIPSRPAIHISLSHCLDTCALAVSDTPIGIDIENMRAQLKRVANKFLTPAELDRLGQSTDDKEQSLYLLKAWTAKEATFKAARHPELVLSGITLNAALTEAETCGATFHITYQLLTPEKVLAIALPAI